MTERERLERLTWWLDQRFRIPGTNRRIGLDGLVGLVPGIGDTATTAIALYVVYRAWQMGAPGPVLGRMAANVGIDYVVGSIPVLGDLFDFAFKANSRNMALLRDWLDSQEGFAFDEFEYSRDRWKA